MSKKECPKCGSDNIIYSNETEVKTKRRGLFGWLWWGFLALITGGLILIIPLLTNSKVKSKSKIVGVCQNCGHKWSV